MEKRINIEHIFVHVFYQLIAGIIYGFSIFTLMKKGYNSAEAGTCLSIASALTLVGQPIISDFLDKSRKISAFDAVIVLAFLCSGLYFANYLLPEKTFTLSVVFVISVFVYALMEPLINSFSSNFINNGLKVEFSSARAIGSISYGVACLIFGFISEVKPYTFIILGGVAFCFALGVTAFVIRKDYYSTFTSEQINEAEIEETIPFKEFLKNNKKFILLCIAFTGIFLGYSSIDNFMLLVMENVGGSSSDMGSCLAFKAFVEAPAIFLFPLLIKKIDLNYLLKGSAIAFIIKAGAMYFARSVGQVYIAQAFQIISFGVILPSMIEYINRYMNKKEAIRANALFTMTICGGAMISSLVAGNIANTYGTSAMELFALVITIISSVAFCLFVGKKK